MRQLSMRTLGIWGAVVVVAGGCMTTQPQPTAAQHREALGSTGEQKMTLGLVQSSISKGMSQADVATTLGSPNMVTQDAEGNETWIYDKISTESTHSSSSKRESAGVGLGTALLAGVGSVAGGVVGGASASSQASQSSGARSQSQRTLTVVIKFDGGKRVSDVRYQSTSF